VRSITVGNAYVASVTSGSQPFDISADGTDTWATLKCQDAVAEINSSTGAVVGYTPLPTGALPEGIASDGTDVWVAESGLAQVQELLASTGAIIGTFALPAGANPWGVSYDGTHVWISNFTAASVSEIVSTPELIPTTLPQGQVGIPYSQTLTAVGGAPGSYTITCVGTPPPGITVTPSSSGVTIFGTPTTGGVYLNAVNCTVSDSTGVYSTDVIPLTVTPLPVGVSPLAPTATTAPPTNVTTTGATLNGAVNPNGTGVSSENFCYIAGITLVRCNGATVVPIVPATLPSSSTPTNLSAMVTGLITGSPYCYQIEATNSIGTSFSTPVCFATAGAGPVITTLLLPNAIQNFPYTTPIATVGGTSPLVFSASGLPKGLSINTTTGVISGTATVVGNYQVTVKVVDAHGLTDSRIYSLKVVVPVNLLPEKLRYITHFGENLSTLNPVDVKTIQLVATFLATHKQLNVSLVGYTDPLDTSAYNLLLGERRAQSVSLQLKADLKKLKIQYVITSTASKGELLPVTPGLSNAARASDRRVTIFVF
jgi:outer membrane protein OmpA-like peptidoglycan-associated protein